MMRCFIVCTHDQVQVLLSIIRVRKSRRMEWVGHIACMGDEKCIQNFEA
jgi:hypothetical protein